MTITPQDLHQIITLARRAPLANMAEAEVAAQLLQKLSAHFAPKPGADPEIVLTPDADAADDNTG
jgi:hypothetical protein